MPELEDECYVRELFEQLYALRLRKVPESNHKTFDFELTVQQRRIAAVEVKTLMATPRTTENGWVHSQQGFVTRTDNAAKRVGAQIHEAYKQLVKASEPRVLVFVNDETLMDFLDLKEAVNGYVIYGEGEERFKNTTGMKVAQGRIREEKLAIDLYVWINRNGRRSLRRMDGLPLEPHAQRGPLFACTSDAGYELATQHFKVPPTQKPKRDPDADIPTLPERLRRHAMQ